MKKALESLDNGERMESIFYYIQKRSDNKPNKNL